MTLVIPGVEIEVVKEVIAPQLSPSGVLGLVGLTEKIPDTMTPVQSWASFITAFGAASAYSLPEAGQAIANGGYEVVISPVAADDAGAAAAAVDIPAATSPDTTGSTENDAARSRAAAEGSPTVARLAARARGPWGNDLRLDVKLRTALDGVKLADVQIKRAAAIVEMIRGIPVESPADPPVKLPSFASQINERSQVLRATPGTRPAAVPAEGAYALTGGKDASEKGFTDALAALENDPTVDMVLVAIQDFSAVRTVASIYSRVVSHCNKMSTSSAGRIGFGQVPGGSGSVSDWNGLVENLRSDRFVLLAPNGVAGAVAGMVGGLQYFQSPTFKTLSGVPDLSRALTVEEQTQLLKTYIVPVAIQRGRGTIVLRGLTTDGDQISVRRVADHAVREVKQIGDMFIGRLNNEEGRGALKQKLTEALVQMQKDGALVPSTDGKDPAFKVNVYSSQLDFAQGIVRVDMAVRPVRAIDYIYATVLVQA